MRVDFSHPVKLLHFLKMFIDDDHDDALPFIVAVPGKAQAFAVCMYVYIYIYYKKKIYIYNMSIL